MSVIDEPFGIGEAGLRKLRHDLLNPLNVLIGTTTMLLQGDLPEVQRALVRTCHSSAERMLSILNSLEDYRDDSSIDAPAQLADLCTIAAARIDKPFDADTLLSVIRRLAPVPRPRILLVDDDPDISSLVHAYLKNANCDIDAVEDGQRAVAQATSQAYDVVFMDINLPGLDGATAAHAIRAADLARGARPTPIVALTGVGGRLTTRPAAEPVVVLNDEETAPLVPAFLDHRREEVPILKKAVEERDFATVQSLGHRMKGTGRGYGLDRVSELGAQIEDAGREHDRTRAAAAIDDLEQYLAHVRVASSE